MVWKYIIQWSYILLCAILPKLRLKLLFFSHSPTINDHVTIRHSAGKAVGVISNVKKS